MNEIKEGLMNGDESFSNLQNIIESIDTGGKGTINYNEFIAATIQTGIYLKEDKLYMAFKAFDQEGKGKISKDDMVRLLGSHEAEGVQRRLVSKE